MTIDRCRTARQVRISLYGYQFRSDANKCYCIGVISK